MGVLIAEPQARTEFASVDESEEAPRDRPDGGAPPPRLVPITHRR